VRETKYYEAKQVFYFCVLTVFNKRQVFLSFTVFLPGRWKLYKSQPGEPGSPSPSQLSDLKGKPQYEHMAGYFQSPVELGRKQSCTAVG
jgi:hypothetical protein